MPGVSVPLQISHTDDIELTVLMILKLCDNLLCFTITQATFKTGLALINCAEQSIPDSIEPYLGRNDFNYREFDNEGLIIWSVNNLLFVVITICELRLHFFLEVRR